MTRCRFRSFVVSYRNSTSNHNLFEEELAPAVLYLIEILHQTTTKGITGVDKNTLYLIEILHQTTTRPRSVSLNVWLYLIEILHQTTTSRRTNLSPRSCILSKFYIKPQPMDDKECLRNVVSYRNSTSNHN